MPMKKINGITMYYEIHGDGEPLVMIMGLSANSDWWPKELIDNFAKHFKVLIFDNRGSGRTDVPEGPFTIKMFADDTVGLMDSLGIEKANILGVSMGGMISQELVLNYPEKVNKLVLGCTNCGGSKQIVASQEVLVTLGPAPEGRTSKDIVENTIPLLFTPKFIEKNPDSIETVRKQLLIAPISPDAFERQVKAIMGFNSYRKLKTISAPTLIIHGKEDILIPVGNAEVLGKQIPNSKIVLLDDAAHSFFEPNPEKAYSSILEFLKAPVEKQVEVKTQ